MTQSSRSQIDTLLMDSRAMRIRLFAFACVITSLISCSEIESPSLAIVPGPELIHSISEYEIEYQTRAESVANELMQHWPKESYVRWRPVRIEPGEVLKGDFLKSGAMPTSLRLSPFPDIELFVHQTGYAAFEHINQALWDGAVLDSDDSSVRITIVGVVEGIGFVIDVWNSPNKYHIFATDSLDVYVAVEVRVNAQGTLD